MREPTALRLLEVACAIEAAAAAADHEPVAILLPSAASVSRASLAATLAGLSLVIVGCGGSRDTWLTEQEYAQRASAICRAGRSAPGPDRASARSKAHLARIDRAIVRAHRRAIAQLSALAPPPKLRDTAGAWLAAIRESERAFIVLLDVTAGRQPLSKAAMEKLATLDRASAAANKLARQLGAADCLDPGGITAYETP